MRIGFFDTEANGYLDQATQVHCMSVIFTDGHETSKARYVGHEQIKEGLSLLDLCDTIVAHNAFGYDLPLLWKVFRWKPKARVEDTLVLSCLLCPDPEGGHHSIEAWGERLGQPKAAYAGPWDAYNETMGAYCDQDVVVLEALWKHLEGVRHGEGWNWEEAIRLEYDFARLFANQGWRGVYVDKPLAEGYVAAWSAESAAIAARVEPLLPARPLNKGEQDDWTPPAKTFKKNGEVTVHAKNWWEDFRRMGNLSYEALKAGTWYKLPHEGPLITELPMRLEDQPLLKEWLMKCGWVPTMWNYKKVKDKNGKLRFVRGDDGELIPTHPKFHDKGILCPGLDAISEQFPLAKDVVRWLQLRHRTSFVQSILDNLRPDGTVRADGMTCGTPTGRVTHQVVANAPKADKEIVLGAECRSIFRARPGRVFVGVDASGLELRIMAHYMGDDEFTKAVVSGKKEDGTDIHTMLWKAGEPYIKNRNMAKTCIYAMIYGASDKKLGLQAGAPVQDAKRIGETIRGMWMTRFPKLKGLIDKVHEAAKRGFLRGLDGRRIKVRSKHSSLNDLFQCGGSLCVKKATIYQNEKMWERKLDAFQVIHYHDEVQDDSSEKDAQEAGGLFVEGLKWAAQAWKLRCPLDGEVKVGLNWRDTH